MRIRKNRKISNSAKRLFFCALLFLCITLILSWAFNKSEPLILPLAETIFKDTVTNTVYETIEDINFANLILPVYGEDGKISSIQMDSASLNLVSNQIIKGIDNKLGEKDINIKIPVGDIIGDSLSLGQGPYITIQLNQYKSSNANITSEFIQSGINQTLHRLTLNLTVETVVLLPGLNTEKIKAELHLPLSETLIVGQTPSTYLDKSVNYQAK